MVWKLMTILFCCTLQIYGQKHIKEARAYFSRKDFVNAKSSFEKALQQPQNPRKKGEIHFHLGQCHYIMHDLNKALKYYEMALQTGYKDPLLLLKTGEVLMKTGNYTDAGHYIKKYLEVCPDDGYARILKKNCNFALTGLKEDPSTIVSNLGNLNSEYAEYGPVMVHGKLLFTSSRKGKGNTETYPVTGHGYTQFYETSFNTMLKDWNYPKVVDAPINSALNEGTSAFDPKTNTLYFMLCNGLSGQASNCAIYASLFDPTTQDWSQPRYIELGPGDYNYGHPALAKDGQVLYFTSDMPGGHGEKDIWYIDLTDKGNARAKNAGLRVNTLGDEVFPFVYRDSLLFFASDGHPGYGGLDIFSIPTKDMQKATPENMQKPINSSYDDFGLMAFTPDSGLFSSNRPGGMGDDDLYAFRHKQEQVTVKGILFGSEKQVLDNALVLLNSTAGPIDSTRSGVDGRYGFAEVELEDLHAITVHKPGYLSHFRFVSEKDKSAARKNSDIPMNFEMIAVTGEEIHLNNIYYDFGKWNLTQESKTELEKLVYLLKLNPDIHISINSHTDTVGSEAFNQELSEYRAQSVVNFLIDNGIGAERLAYKGWGETKPYIANATTEEQQKLNRRTTFQIVNASDVNLAHTHANYSKLAESIISERDRGSQNAERNNPNERKVVFKLQVYAGKQRISREFRNELEKHIGRYQLETIRGEDGYFRYAVGNFMRFEQAMEMKGNLKNNNIDSFVIAFMNNLRVTILEARQMSENQ
jgi:peptidoglycan-associated lipoprotein